MNNYPYVEAFQQGGRQRHLSVIRVVPSETTSDTGAALGVAQRQHLSDAPHEAFHFTVDETRIYQCVPIKTQAGHFHCANKGEIGIKLCFDPPDVQYGWDDFQHTKLLDNLVDLLALLTVQYKIRPRFLTQKEYDAWRFKSFKTRSSGGIFLDFGVWSPESYLLSALKEKRENF